MTRWMPEALKRQLRPLPQWSAIALHDPQKAVAIRMCTAGREDDVTRSSVVASLRPLTLAIGLDEHLQPASGDKYEPELRFMDVESRQTLAVLNLRQVGSIAAAGGAIGLFEISCGEQYCTRWPYKPWNRWLQNRAMRKNVDPSNFSMPPDAAQQMMIFYICPRPVVLVSVEDGGHSNVFPMDLIGPMSSNTFTLALRSTSQSIATMKSARRVAIADVAAQDRAIAYQLGAHHKKQVIDWDRLPFKIERSGNYSLPCPDIALRVRELDIQSFETIGSHTFFITRIASDRRMREGAQLFHTSGIHQHFRARHARAFAPAL